MVMHMQRAITVLFLKYGVVVMAMQVPCANRRLRVAKDCLRSGSLAVFPRHHGRWHHPAFPANLLQAAISADAPVQPVALRLNGATGQIGCTLPVRRRYLPCGAPVR